MSFYYHLDPSLSFLFSKLVFQLKIIEITIIKQKEFLISELSNISNIVTKLKKTSAKNLVISDIVFGKTLQFSFEPINPTMYVYIGRKKTLFMGFPVEW